MLDWYAGFKRLRTKLIDLSLRLDRSLRCHTQSVRKQTCERLPSAAPTRRVRLELGEHDAVCNYLLPAPAWEVALNGNLVLPPTDCRNQGARLIATISFIASTMFAC